MASKNFMLSGDQLTANEHAKCLHQCGKQSGDLLKCQHLNPVGQKPCESIVHVSCLQMFEINLLPHLQKFYCSKCCTASPSLKEEMIRVVNEARQALAHSKSMQTCSSATNEEVKNLKEALKAMETQLSKTVAQLQAQLNLNHKIEKRLEEVEKEKESFKEEVTKLQAASSKMLKRSTSDAENFQAADIEMSNPAFGSLNQTIGYASQVLRKAQDQRIKIEGKLKQSSSCPAFNLQDALIDLTNMPDYEEHEIKANAMTEMSLSLLRSSIAKPQPFQGDVTTWAIFLSEFKRTSSRGHYRAVEDMDRLRELIRGDALEMFGTELADPFAEPTKILQRLDEFYGVRGNAVRVCLDRILSLARVDKPSEKNQLKTLYVGAKSFAHQCRANNKESELTSQAVIYILESKMFHDHAKAWRLWARDNHKEESVDGIVAFLEERIRELNIMPQKTKAATSLLFTDVTGGLASSTSQSAQGSSASHAKKEESNYDQNKRRKKRQKKLDKIECFKCKEHHPFWKCPILIKASDPIRLQIVNQLRVCHRCLSSTKHETSNCPNKLMQCRVPDCTAVNKHPLLHGHPPDKIKRFTEIAMHQVLNVQAERLTSHYGMIPGHVIAKDGQWIPITVMLDSGSGISLATKALFNRSGLSQTEQYELCMKWTSDAVHVESNAVVFDIPFIPYSRKDPIIIKNVTAIANESLDLPEQQQDANNIKMNFPYLENVPIPSYPAQKPQLLLGLPHIGLFTHFSCVSGPNYNDPVAVLTKLGWVIYGTNTQSQKYEKLNSSIPVGFTCIECTSNDMSNDVIFQHFKYFNSIDNMGIAHKDATLMSSEDQLAHNILKDTLKYLPELNRYEVGMLWRPGVSSMPDNYDQAVSRLEASEKRLKKLKMDKFVNDQMNEQIQAGWLVETTREEASNYPKRNYVFGFLVFNQNKTPPKPRWVNDTAAKFNGVSLNSMLLKGPDNLVPLQQSICATRECKVAYQADIKAMFNQIMLRYEDQFSQLCLWRNCDASQSPKIYRQTRVIFGPTSSPSEANGVRIDHANNCKEKFPEAADVALHQMYVDDIADSRDTVEEAAKVANNLIEMFDLIGWPLVEFYSNSQEFLRLIPQERIGKKMVEIVDEHENFITKVLGLFWMPHLDVYVFRTNDETLIKKCANENYKASKREVLGIIMRIFDPQGIIIPFRIRGLIIMQHIWRTGTDWKGTLPLEVDEEFKKWILDFHVVTNLKIPRCYTDVPLKDCELSLHVFVDAGTEAYAACVYLRAVYNDQIFVRLIAAKGRVAPIKYMSIPKLELMSGLLGARLLESVKKWHRRLNFKSYFCWTDSITSYKWIKSPHLPRTPFTAPRISEIQELTSADRWRYVPSKQNVADYGTKQREMDYSNSSHEWYTGPEFLYNSEEYWPKQPSEKSSKAEASKVFHVLTIKGMFTWKAGIIGGVSAKYRSDWRKYSHVVARALRFVDHLSLVKPRNFLNGNFTCHEIHRAENFIIRSIQMATYPEEYLRLSKGKKVLRGSKIRSLMPFLCKQTGLIRAFTRFSTNYPLDQRQPPILPNFHETSDAIAAFYHRTQLHVNDATIIGAMRTRVWILSAKRIARRVRARCLLCILKRAKAAHPTGSSLPDFRLDISQKPFYYTGCDLFGPFETYVKRSKSKETIYVVIFTCLVTRAVYFEVLNDMSTQSFLVALDKLWARRGPIVHMYSDNGRNFCGAAKVIEEQSKENPLKHVIEADEIQGLLTDKKVTWHFTPPYTPQFGGTWERLIRDTKRALDASLGKFTVPRAVFEAALAKIETNMNNRPLTDLPILPNDQIPLTPYLLMQGYQNYPIMDEGCCQQSSLIPQLKMAEQISSLVQTFRSRFIREYGPVITRAIGKDNRMVNKSLSLKEGDYVIYLDPTVSISHWPKGVVSRVYPGKDKKVRVVDVKLPCGKVLERRSTHRVAKIDIRLENPEAEQKKYSQIYPENSKNSTDFQSSKFLTVTKNSKIKSKISSKTDPSKNSTEVQKNSHYNLLIKNHITMDEERFSGTIFDDDLSLADGVVNRVENPSLSEQERELYYDYQKTRTIVADNIPPNLGATEIFQIFERFGNVVTIKATSYDGLRPSRVFIAYETEFAAHSSTNYNGSQLVITSGMAYRTSIAFPLKDVKLYGKHQLVTLVTFASRIHGTTNKVLFITNKRPNKLCLNTPMPISSNSYGHVHSCVPEEEFTVSSIPINMNDLQNETDKIERRSKFFITARTETSSQAVPTVANIQPSTSTNVEDDDPTLDINWDEDPFSDNDDEQIEDLRDLLNKKRRII